MLIETLVARSSSVTVGPCSRRHSSRSARPVGWPAGCTRTRPRTRISSPAIRRCCIASASSRHSGSRNRSSSPSAAARAGGILTPQAAPTGALARRAARSACPTSTSTASRASSSRSAISGGDDGLEVAPLLPEGEIDAALVSQCARRDRRLADLRRHAGIEGPHCHDHRCGAARRETQRRDLSGGTRPDRVAACAARHRGLRRRRGRDHRLFLVLHRPRRRPAGAVHRYRGDARAVLRLSHDPQRGAADVHRRCDHRRRRWAQWRRAASRSTRSPTAWSSC